MKISAVKGVVFAAEALGAPENQKSQLKSQLLRIALEINDGTRQTWRTSVERRPNF